MSDDWRRKALDKVVMEREARQAKNGNMKGWRKMARGYSIYLPQTLWARVREAAKTEDVNIGGFFRRAILARTAMVLGGGLAEDLAFVPAPRGWNEGSSTMPAVIMPPDQFDTWTPCTHPGCDSEHLR